MLIPLAAVLLAFLVVPSPWGTLVLAAVIVWEVAEKAYWLRYTKRLPITAGPEALVGLPVTALSACRPEGRVRLHGGIWSARCSDGAEPGETLVIEGIDRITLIVRKDDLAAACA